MNKVADRGDEDLTWLLRFSGKEIRFLKINQRFFYNPAG
jgi:hypothetical protein